MYNKCAIKPPFFEIGPKSYIYGEDILKLALAADKAAIKYDIDVIFTAPFCDIRTVAANTKRIFVFAPHMDPLLPGRGLADILPESIKAAGAVGVILNHCEKPLDISTLNKTLRRADELDLITLVCADSLAESKAVAQLSPNIIAAEPVEIIGSNKKSPAEYVIGTIKAIKNINQNIFVLQGGGISSSSDVYRNIYLGADATGSSSHIATAKDPASVAEEMIRTVREAYNARINI